VQQINYIFGSNTINKDISEFMSINLNSIDPKDVYI